MITFNTADITKYTSTTPFQEDTGNMWEWIRIINKSPYTARANFGGAGTVDFPEMYLEDIFTGEGSGYNGVVQIFPVQQFTTAFISSAPSTLVTIIGYSKNDKHVPVAQPLTVLAAVGNVLNVSTVQTLSNEGGTNALVIDIGDSANPNLITIYQDGHALYYVDQSGTKHQVLKMNATGIPLEIGMANDTTQVNSSLNCVQATGFSLQTTNNAKVGGTFESVGAATMDGTLTVTGDATLNGAGTGLAVTNNETVGGTLSVTGATTLTGAVTATNNSNSIQASTLQGGANLPAGRLGLAADGDILDGNSATATYIKARTAGSIIFQTPNGTEIIHVDSSGITLASGKDVIFGGKIRLQAGNLARMTSFSGTGNGTVNTNLGVTPTQITFNPCNVSGSSQTIGGSNAQSTVVTTGSGLGWGGVAYHDT